MLQNVFSVVRVVSIDGALCMQLYFVYCLNYGDGDIINSSNWYLYCDCVVHINEFQYVAIEMSEACVYGSGNITGYDLSPLSEWCFYFVL